MPCIYTFFIYSHIVHLQILTDAKDYLERRRTTWYRLHICFADVKSDWEEEVILPVFQVKQLERVADGR